MSRRWLVYSWIKNSVYCFSCKLFAQPTKNALIGKDSFSDWKHLPERLKEHENSRYHRENMIQWFNFENRLKDKTTIDAACQQRIEREKQKLVKVLQRVVEIIQFLESRKLAFRGKNETLFQGQNGNFIGLIELLSKLNPVMEEHVTRFMKSEFRNHYLSVRIQNELIAAMVQKMTNSIIEKQKNAKYHSVLLGYNHDVSHKKRLSVIVCIVVIDKQDFQIVEHFLNFLAVYDTREKGLVETLKEKLHNQGLKLSDCRGQGYDNGPKMKDKHQGVQAN